MALPPPKSPVRRGFTLLEVIVILLVSVLILVLLTPLFLRQREAARKLQCMGQLKRLGMALHNYYDAYQVFPPGCTGQAKSEAVLADDWGYSWWALILPYIDQTALYNQWNFGLPNSGHNGQLPLLRGVEIPLARCPSSPLSSYKFTASGLAVAHYAGVAGAIECISPYDSDVHDFHAGECVPAGTLKQSKTTANGIQAWNGVLFYESQIGIRDITDGTSNTAFVIEQSGFLRNTRNGSQTIAISSWPKGMWAGSLDQDHFFNVTTVRHTVGYDQSEGNDDSTGCALTGVCGNLGNNNPIQSAHSDGAQILLSDGSVRFVNIITPFHIVHGLSTRAGAWSGSF